MVFVMPPSSQNDEISSYLAKISALYSGVKRSAYSLISKFSHVFASCSLKPPFMGVFSPGKHNNVGKLGFITKR